MTSTTVAALGTTKADLAAIRSALPRAAPWTARRITDADAAWIAVRHRRGPAWAIGRQDGTIFAAPENGEGDGRSGFADFAEAARYVTEAARSA